MSDLIEEKITPGVGNAVVNAGGKMLKLVELRQRYGKAGDGESKALLLAPSPTGDRLAELTTPQDARKQALSKLTAEERAALGLE